jgi:hypothetical protein
MGPTSQLTSDCARRRSSSARSTCDALCRRPHQQLALHTGGARGARAGGAWLGWDNYRHHGATSCSSRRYRSPSPTGRGVCSCSWTLLGPPLYHCGGRHCWGRECGAACNAASSQGWSQQTEKSFRKREATTAVGASHRRVRVISDTSTTQHASAKHANTRAHEPMNTHLAVCFWRPGPCEPAASCSWPAASSRYCAFAPPPSPRGPEVLVPEVQVLPHIRIMPSEHA